LAGPNPWPVFSTTRPGSILGSRIDPSGQLGFKTLISILKKLNKPHKLNKKNKRLVTQIDKIKGNILKYKDNKRLNIKLYSFLKKEKITY
jgi:hypothetical protein